MQTMNIFQGLAEWSHQHYAKAVPYLPRLACNHICIKSAKETIDPVLQLSREKPSHAETAYKNPGNY